MTLRELLRRRCVFLAWAAVWCVLVGLSCELLGVAEPYPEHPFVSIDQGRQW